MITSTVGLSCEIPGRLREIPRVSSTRRCLANLGGETGSPLWREIEGEMNEAPPT